MSLLWVHFKKAKLEAVAQTCSVKKVFLEILHYMFDTARVSGKTIWCLKDGLDVIIQTRAILFKECFYRGPKDFISIK